MEQIIQGDYTGLDFEKLVGRNAALDYSRVNFYNHKFIKLDSTQVSQSTELAAEIKPLIENFTKANLPAFLKRKKGMNILFNIPLSSYSCLFQFLCSIPQTKNILYEVILLMTHNPI